ncbi:MAG: hypothetical protein JO257_22365 [Deltaproteobacteria bacterium]|nr:hypothetical protein [Deltaproteobacteria bacterium]
MRIVVLLLVLASATARADKSPETAKYLSGGASAVSGAVLLYAFLEPPLGEPFDKPVLITGLALAVVTPSLGEYYAGEYFTPGFAIRIAAGGLAAYAMQNETEKTTCDTASNATDPKCERLKGAGVALVGVAALGFIGGMWYDSLDAEDAVGRWRKRHNIVVAPTSNGVALGGSF